MKTLIKRTEIEKVDANKVHKLLNELSHNSEPMSGIEHMDKSEVKDAIGKLLSIVEKSDPDHYKALKENNE